MSSFLNTSFELFRIHCFSGKIIINSFDIDIVLKSLQKGLFEV